MSCAGSSSRLQQRREPFLAKPFELRRRERRTERNVRHHRQCLVEPATGTLSRTADASEELVVDEVGAEVVDRIGDLAATIASRPLRPASRP